MGLFLPQNPGIGGIDELTPSEEVFVMNLVGLDYQRGDILYYNGTTLTVLHPGTSGKFLKTQGAGADPIWDTASGGAADSFETVSANLSAYDSTLNYTSGNITSIVYSNGVTKTFNYTGADITSIVLSGSTPGGISLTKTLTYTDGEVTGITYS